MKGKILKILRSEKGVVSGALLSDKLAISRVSIWKHVHKLRELGYNILSTPKGYQLTGTDDLLFAWEFPGRESRIHYFPEISSTMDMARDLARNNCPHFTVVIAGSQTKGRGRLQRKWLSKEGGLYFTIVIRPQIPQAICSRVNFVASLELARVLRKTYGIKAMVKWPNDIMVDGFKLSGMLSEMEAEGDMVTFVNVGFGINVNNDPSPEEPMAISLKKIIGRAISRRELISLFLDELENRLNYENYKNVIGEWKNYTMTLNRQVKIVTGHDVTKGVAVDVDDDGALLLELEDGSITKIIYGDCFHQDEK